MRRIVLVSSAIIGCVLFVAGRAATAQTVPDTGLAPRAPGYGHESRDATAQPTTPTTKSAATPARRGGAQPGNADTERNTDRDEEMPGNGSAIGSSGRSRRPARVSRYERRKRHWLYLRSHPGLRRAFDRKQGSRSRRSVGIARGFWTEAHFGVTSAVGRMTSGVALGGRWHKFVVAVLLDLSYVWQKGKDDSTGAPDALTNQNMTLAIGPEFEFQALRLGLFEVYGSAALTFISAWNKVQDEQQNSWGEWKKDTTTTKAYGFGLSGGAGARYYFGGRIGLGVEFGLTMRYVKGSVGPSGSGPDAKQFAISPYGMASIVSIW